MRVFTDYSLSRPVLSASGLHSLWVQPLVLTNLFCVQVALLVCYLLCSCCPSSFLLLLMRVSFFLFSLLCL